MRLYIMRHGHAADSSPSGRDADRPLTDDGHKIVERVGELLQAHHGTTLARILSSPYLRAAQTADIMVRAIASADALFDHHQELEPDEPIPMGMLRKLVESDVDALIVGHHPMVIAMSRLLARDSSKLPLGLHPSMLVGLERPARRDSPLPIEGSFQVTTVLKP